MTHERGRELVLNALAYGHTRSAADVVARLERAGVRLEADVVELMLHELAEERLVDAVGSGWRRR